MKILSIYEKMKKISLNLNESNKHLKVNEKLIRKFVAIL